VGLSGGAFKKGLSNDKISNNLNSGRIYSSSATSLKLHGELTIPLFKNKI